MRRALRKLWWTVSDGDPVVGALVVGLVALYVLTRGVFQGKASGDGLSTLLYLPSIFVHHTLDSRQAVEEAHAFVLPFVNGHMINRYPVGPSLLWSPFYVLGLGVESVGRALGAWRGEPFGNNYVSYWFCGLGTLVWALVAIGAMFRFLRRRFAVGASRFGVIAAVLGTPTVWYLVHQPTYQHGLSFALAVLIVERWDVWRAAPTWRQHVALGALIGLAALVRTQELIFLVIPAFDVVAAMIAIARDSGAERARRLAVVAGKGLVTLLVALAVFALQVLVWRYYLGEWKTSASWDWMRWGRPEVIGLLFSTRSGLFAWSPLVYLALFGFAVSRRTRGLLPIAMLVVLAADTWVNAVKSDWWGQWSFGARRFCDVAVVFAFGFAAAWERFPRRGWRSFCVALTTLVVGWSFVCMEYIRQGKLHSTGGFASGMWERLRTMHAPAPLWRTFRAIGWPPCWPASIPWALSHDVPVRKFEEVYGNYFLTKLYRDDFRGHRDFELTDDNARRFLISGFTTVRDDGRAEVVSPARVFIPVFEAIPVTVTIDGAFPPGVATATWNGRAVSVTKSPTAITFSARARYGVNDLRLDVPTGSTVSALRANDLPR
jgi:hypothetical protein